MNLGRLTDVFRDVFDNSDLEISPDTVIKDIQGWDSLVHVTLMAAVQDEFGIRYSIDDIVKMKTAGDILDFIDGRRS
jgi:acyl carrier protein